MARAALRWGVRELGAKAGITATTVTRFETGKSRGYADTVAKLQTALQEAGVVFLAEDAQGGPGVRLKKGMS